MASESADSNPDAKEVKLPNLTKYAGDTEPFANLPPLKPSFENYYLDAEIVYLKHSLRDVREIVISAHHILKWEKQWYPGAIAGVSSIIFMFLWLAEPSLLTTVSVLGLIITLTDYLLPTILSTFVTQGNWTVSKEKEFEEICQTLVLWKNNISLLFRSFYLHRTTRPKFYYGTVIVSLMFMAWLGYVFNNLFFTYVFVTTLLLAPGMKKHGICAEYGNALTQKFFELTNNAKSMASKSKKQ